MKVWNFVREHTIPLIITSVVSSVIGVVVVAWTPLGDLVNQETNETLDRIQAEQERARQSSEDYYDLTQAMLPSDIDELIDQSDVAVADGRIDDAKVYLTRARNIAKSLDDKALVSFEYAGVMTSLGEWESATSEYENALKYAAPLADQQLRGLILGQYSLLLEHMGHLQSAEQHFSEALAVFRELPDDVGIAKTLYNLGLLKKGQGDLISSDRYLDEALEVNRRIGRYTGEALTLTEKGRQRLYSNRRPEAISLYTEAREVALSHNDTLSALQPNYGLAIAARMGGDYSAALAYAKEALNASKVNNLPGLEVELLGYVGSLYRLLADLDTAEDYHSQARDLARAFESSWAESRAIIDLAIVASLRRDNATAKTLLLEALDIARTGKNLDAEFMALDSLGQAAAEEGRREEARKYLCQAWRLARKLPTPEFFLQSEGALRALVGEPKRVCGWW